MAELEGDRVAEIEIETHIDPAGTCIVTLAGELDTSNVASLEATMASITQQSPPRLIFDLGDLRFMDSAGIAVLLNAASTSSRSISTPLPSCKPTTLSNGCWT